MRDNWTSGKNGKMGNKVTAECTCFFLAVLHGCEALDQWLHFIATEQGQARWQIFSYCLKTEGTGLRSELGIHFRWHGWYVCQWQPKNVNGTELGWQFNVGDCGQPAVCKRSGLWKPPKLCSDVPFSHWHIYPATLPFQLNIPIVKTTVCLRCIYSVVPC